MSGTLPLLVVGAGPAGMAAAVTARRFGVDTLVVDENAAPGGQVWRNVERVAASRPDTLALLGADYRRGHDLVTRFRASGARFEPGTGVWQVDARRGDGGIEVGLVGDTGARIVRVERVVMATGAMERPVPFPGGTLPGVMSAGAAQTLLKNAGLVPSARTVLAGSGPLLMLLAWQLARAGAPPAAVWLTVPRDRLPASLAELPRALTAPGPLFKGVAWLRELRAMGVRVEWGAMSLRAEGEAGVERVRAVVGGAERCEEAGLLLVHEGVVPSLHLPLSAGCAVDYDTAQHCFRPVLDGACNTTVPGLLVAGDGAGIGGAEAAVVRGRMAGVEAAWSLGAVDATLRASLLAADRRALARALATRPWLDRVFEPSAAVLAPDDESVTVCRCEMVTGAEIRRLAAIGVRGPNQGKAFSRCGMGPCQGRMCALPVAGLLARHTGRGPGEVGHYRQRPPIRPLTVAELAGVDGLDAPPGGPARRPL